MEIFAVKSFAFFLNHKNFAHKFAYAEQLVTMRYYQGQLSQSIFIFQSLYSVCSLPSLERERKYVKLSLVSGQWLLRLSILLWHANLHCSMNLLDLSINMVGTHARTHRDEAIILKILLIMLFHNTQNLDRLRLRWSPIMPKLFHIACIQVEDCPLFYTSWRCQQM